MDFLQQDYLVCFIKVDSAHLGEPAMRRRIYFILVRRHELVFESEELDSMLSQCFWHLNFKIIANTLKHVTCTRDVARATIKNHRHLETHCNEVYKKLKLDFIPTIGPPASYDSYSLQKPINLTPLRCTWGQTCCFRTIASTFRPFRRIWLLRPSQQERLPIMTLPQGSSVALVNLAAILNVHFVFFWGRLLEFILGQSQIVLDGWKSTGERCVSWRHPSWVTSKTWYWL